MPYSTIWEKLGVVWKFSGEVSAEEIESANTEFYNNERNEKFIYQIIDATEVTGVEWNAPDIKTIAALDIGATHLVRNMKVAYVALDDDIISKLENYINLSRKLNSSWKFKGFKNLSEARKWIMS